PAGRAAMTRRHGTGSALVRPLSARRLLGLVVCAAMLAWPPAAEAHKPSDSYLSITVEGTRVRGQWDIALRDLDYAIALDADGDGALTWGEVRGQMGRITAYAFDRLALRLGDLDGTLKLEEMLIDQ